MIYISPVTVNHAGPLAHLHIQFFFKYLTPNKKKLKNSHHLMFVGSVRMTYILQMVNYWCAGTDTLPILACQPLSSS